MEEYINHILEDFTVVDWTLVGTLLVLFAIQMFYYFYYFNQLIRQQRRINQNQVDYSSTLPPVSVIICAQNEADNLEKYLPMVLNQDYPNFEVIVVNDGSTDQSSHYLERMEKEYKHLYRTFLPMDAQYLSRKKMCLSVGMKAAKNEHLVFLDADSEPASKVWLKEMMKNYVSGKDVVFGYSRSEGTSGFLEKIIRYDSITSAMEFMGFALSGNPYRGDCRNLSYKKSCFFNSRRFSDQLHLASGDDSIFIQEIANANNTRVEFAPMAITLTHRDETFKSYRYQKENRLKTLSKYKSNILAHFTAEMASRLLFYPVALWAILNFALQQDWIASGVMAFFFLFRFITQAIIIRKSATLLSEKKFLLMIPVLDILLPILFGYFQTFGKVGTRKTEVWRV